MSLYAANTQNLNSNASIMESYNLTSKMNNSECSRTWQKNLAIKLKRCSSLKTENHYEISYKALKQIQLLNISEF